MFKTGLGVLRRHAFQKVTAVDVVSGRRGVHKDFHAPEWDLKYHRKVDMYEGDRSWHSQLRRRGPLKDQFEYYDEVVWRPEYRYPDGEAKMGEVFHVAENVKHSPLKLFYACQLAQGRSVDDADKQLQYIPRKSAIILRQVLKEAVDKALEKHGIEYRSNLWIAECFAIKSIGIRGVRRHARERWGEVEYKFSNIFVRLEEGQPPLYRTRDGKPPTDRGFGDGQEYLEFLRERRVKYGL